MKKWQETIKLKKNDEKLSCSLYASVSILFKLIYFLLSNNLICTNDQHSQPQEDCKPSMILTCKT